MTIEPNLSQLKARFNEIDIRLGKLNNGLTDPQLTEDPVSKDEGQAIVHRFIVQRADLIQDEAEGSLNVADLMHERFSLLARYSHPTTAEQAQVKFNQMNGDLKHAISSVVQSHNLLADLKEKVPQANAERGNALGARTQATINESQRFLTAMNQSPLSPETAAAFYQNYQTPADPIAAFSANTAQVADAYVRLAETSLNRVESVMTYVGAIDTVLKPLFPEHVQQLTNAQKDSLKEASTAFDTGKKYMTMAEQYGAKPS